MFWSTTGAMAEQIKNAVAAIPVMPKGQLTANAAQDLERQVASAAIVLGNIDKHLQELRAECEPLLEKWRSTIAGMNQLSWRLKQGSSCCGA
jgi:hypothetical protein